MAAARASHRDAVVGAATLAAGVTLAVAGGRNRTVWETRARESGHDDAVHCYRLVWTRLLAIDFALNTALAAALGVWTLSWPGDRNERVADAAPYFVSAVASAVIAIAALQVHLSWLGRSRRLLLTPSVGGTAVGLTVTGTF